jgi:CRISPR-associated protein Cmr3
MSQFQFLVTVSPLGLMYGSAGAFLSPANLVGRSGSKFPPDASALAGLFFNANREQKFADHHDLKKNLVVAGPFWAKRDKPSQFYVPIPWSQIVGEKEDDEWSLALKQAQEPSEGSSDSASSESQWSLGKHRWERQIKDLNPAYYWQTIDAWNSSSRQMREAGAIAPNPWEMVSFLHPKLKTTERHVLDQDGLFLENAVQIREDYCLVYLANYELPEDWYRFGGEGHLVEIESHPLSTEHIINRLLRQKIQQACALITPGVWGSNKLSHRYPLHAEFPREQIKMLTDRPVPYRYRLGQPKPESSADRPYNAAQTGRLSRGRYAVPAGSVYVFKHPLERTWWEFPDDWFPKEGFHLKHLGCGLCLPINIQGVPSCTAKPTV